MYESCRRRRVVLVAFVVAALAMVSERLSVPAKIMYAGARINQERSQRGLKSREQHMLVSLKGVKTIFVNLMCDKRNENACELRLASNNNRSRARKRDECA